MKPDEQEKWDAETLAFFRKRVLKKCEQIRQQQAAVEEREHVRAEAEDKADNMLRQLSFSLGSDPKDCPDVPWWAAVDPLADEALAAHEARAAARAEERLAKSALKILQLEILEMLTRYKAPTPLFDFAKKQEAEGNPSASKQ